MDDYTKHEFKEIAWLAIYVTFVIGILSLFFGLGAGGFEREAVLQKNIFSQSCKNYLHQDCAFELRLVFGCFTVHLISVNLVNSYR